MDNQNSVLDQRVQKLEKLCESLLSRICELEDASEHLSEQVKKLETKNQKLEQQLKQLNSPTNQQIEESWLFYCEKNRTLDQIAKALEMQSNHIYQLDYAKWDREEAMWRQILSCLSVQKQDLSKMNHQQLKAAGLTCLKAHEQTETLIVLRNVPNVQQKLAPLVELCEAITICWTEMELDDDCQGRILLVLESENNLEKLEVMASDKQKIILQIEKLQ